MNDRQSRPDRRAFARQMLVACGAAVAMACGEPSQAGSTAPAGQSAAAQPMLVIEHLVPRRDFVGPQPDRFVWSAAAGADAYAIGVWNEVDVLMWRQDGVAGTSVDRPESLDLDSGTYFWQVTGLQQGRAIAQSGRAAFVVE